MGQKHDLRCSKCGYEIDALLGIGMLYSVENIFEGDKPLLPELVGDEKITQQALELVKNGATIDENYGHSLYACPEDFYLFDKFYFQVGDFEPKYHCPYCQNILKRVDFAKGTAGKARLKFWGQAKYWHCPRCGNDEVIEYSFANWD